MVEKEITISIRLSVEDNQMIENFIAERKIDNRSRFIRDAIAGYIELQKRAGRSTTEIGEGIFVRLREIHLETLKLMVEDGTAFSEEEFVRNCVLDKLVSKESEADSADRAFKAAQTASRNK